MRLSTCFVWFLIMRKRGAMSERVEKAPDKKREDEPWKGIDDPFKLFLTERSSTSKLTTN